VIVISGAMDLAGLRARIDRLLERYLDAKRARLGAGLEPVLEGAEALTRRGGKRQRPALVFAGHAAVAPIADVDAMAEAAAAFELLQTYLLIQDDWMDQDDTRRGGPSVHAKLRQTFDRHTGDSVAILASDLASTDAWSMLLNARFPADRVLEALRAFAAMNEEVVLGQYLDVVGSADVERVHLWKTAGYTVRWPVAIGAILGGASADQRAALEAWARPIGLAFQMRDDLLGTFGDPAVTGKPAGNDLLRKKETVVRARGRAMWPAIEALVASGGVAPAIEALERAGIKDAIEADIAALVAEAASALAAGTFRQEGLTALSTLAKALTARST